MLRRARLILRSVGVSAIGRAFGQPRLWLNAVIHPVLLRIVASHEVIPQPG